MKIDLDELERKARAATQDEWVRGKWYWERPPNVVPWTEENKTLMRDANCRGHIVTKHTKEEVVSGCGCCGSPDASDADAEHIVANSPPVTLELIARIRHLEVEVELRERAIIANGDTISQIQKQNGELVTAHVNLRGLVEEWALARDRFEGWPVQDAEDEFRSASNRLAETCDEVKP